MTRTADRGERAVIAEALGRLGDERAVEPLAGVLIGDDHPNDDRTVAPHDNLSRYWERALCETVANALIKLRAVSVVEPLMAVLERQGLQTPASAIRVLGRLGGRRATGPLLHLLEDPALPWVLERPAPPTGDVVRALVSALADRGDRRAVAPILRLLATLRAGKGGSLTLTYEGRSSDDPLYRTWSAIEALGQLGDPRAIEPLLALIRPRSMLADDATRALARITDQRTLDGLRRVQPEFRTDSALGVQIGKAIATLERSLAQRAGKQMPAHSD